ncbi:MAG TPA: hypothetical protein VFY29_05030 [Terriglobia bacterium]|nr:hypothetical protein [Terriglobia bacterium]
MKTRYFGETKVTPDGTFEFLHVPPDVYTARVFQPGGSDLAALTRLVARGVDISGIQLMVTNPAPAAVAPGAVPVVVADVRPAALQARLELLGGPTARDCGHASVAQILEGSGMEVIKCIEDAIVKKAAFAASLQLQAGDPMLVTGIAAPPQSIPVTVWSLGGMLRRPNSASTRK